MRTLTADEVAHLRAARARRTTWAHLARVLTAADHAAGLLPDGQCWTGPTLRYVVEHPAPVRVEHAHRADSADGSGLSPSVLEGMVEGRGSGA